MKKTFLFLTNRKHKYLVGMKGLEPSRLTARAPKARVYTNFTTSPNSIVNYKLTEVFYFILR
jgi:hypothetical protein